MVNLPVRDRRRRVLKDEVLAASNNYANLRSRKDDSDATDAPRYSDAAGVENHPQITDFIPRRYSSIATLIAIGAGVTAALVAGQLFLLPLSTSSRLHGGAIFDLAAYGSLGSWFAAVVLLISSATSLLVLSIRRHRIDDFRGRYRIWFGATVACLLGSIDSVVGFHQIGADVFGSMTGWTAMRDGAVWWLTLAGLPVAWIAFRSLLDVRDCRLAAALLVAAIACYTTSAGAYLGLPRIADPQSRSMAAGASLLMGHWLVLAALVTYARFVVLDAQGLITLRCRNVTKKTSKAEDGKSTASAATAKPATTVFTAAGLSRPTLQVAKTPADSSHWVDGSRPERVHYERDEEDDDSADGKLSKADRKRLRKLKAQGRAA